jgi:hypothetical protein
MSQNFHCEYFHNSVVPTQGEMMILEAGDTALVISFHISPFFEPFFFLVWQNSRE